MATLPPAAGQPSSTFPVWNSSAPWAWACLSRVPGRSNVSARKWSCSIPNPKSKRRSRRWASIRAFPSSTASMKACASSTPPLNVMPPTFQRTLARNVPAYLPLAEEVERFCADHGLGQAVTFKLRLIVEELVLNLIDHAVDPKTDHINLRIEIEPNRIILIVEDDSAPFDPHSAPPFDKTKPLEERTPRGMGLHLVRTMAQ